MFIIIQSLDTGCIYRFSLFSKDRNTIRIDRLNNTVIDQTDIEIRSYQHTTTESSRIFQVMNH